MELKQPSVHRNLGGINRTEWNTVLTEMRKLASMLRGTLKNTDHNSALNVSRLIPSAITNFAMLLRVPFALR